jgi:hypothetical protein
VFWCLVDTLPLQCQKGCSYRKGSNMTLGASIEATHSHGVLGVKLGVNCQLGACDNILLPTPLMPH